MENGCSIFEGLERFAQNFRYNFSGAIRPTMGHETRNRFHLVRSLEKSQSYGDGFPEIRVKKFARAFCRVRLHRNGEKIRKKTFNGNTRGFYCAKRHRGVPLRFLLLVSRDLLLILIGSTIIGSTIIGSTVSYSIIQ